MVTWDEDINFASALLLHSCPTVFVKESLNLLTIVIRLAPFRRKARPQTPNARSVLLDGYTSILSNDNDGGLAELYFTNTGLLLLSASLASAIAMNLSLSDMVLNVFVACTFGFCFVVSVFSCRRSLLIFILALRRAGRLVWSDTPFVNFFSLIYVAMVLKSSTTMRLKDYVTLRSIAIIELVFMKAYIAAASMDRQNRAIAFSVQVSACASPGTVMLIKTTIGHEFGSVRGSKGPGTIPVPPVGFFANDDVGSGDWRVYRLRADVMLITDNLRATDPKEWWKRLIKRMHEIFLKRLKKVRVVYLLRVGVEHVVGDSSEGEVSHLVSNVNLVTGINKLLVAAVLGFATTALAQEGKCTAKGECQENTSGVRLFCSSGSCDGKEGQSCTRNGPGSSNVANCPK
ncbi:hypothetical protein CSAL01_03567 [Colletotrichum salicis]|uniref:Uncharacterized protein n=1 Tax=Colletotrichum salicis TaxID=1209931 RepID=A0A135V4P6_9PEZI|nr:hypothetical protein CSAL01_03567 [Colletotrichum salicis]